MRPTDTRFIKFMRRARSVVTLFGGGGGATTINVATSTAQLQNASGAQVTIGQVVYLTGSGTFGLATSASDLAHATAVGIVQDAAIANNASGNIVLYGLVTGLAGGVAGNNGYLNAAAGTIGAALDVTPGHYASTLGKWLTATQFRFQPTSPYLV